MTIYAFTDYVQIDETWEIPADLYTELSKIEDIFYNLFPHTLPDAVGLITGGDHPWAEEIAVEGILNQLPYDDIARKIFYDYDPTPECLPIGEMF